MMVACVDTGDLYVIDHMQVQIRRLTQKAHLLFDADNYDFFEFPFLRANRES